MKEGRKMKDDSQVSSLVVPVTERRQEEEQLERKACPIFDMSLRYLCVTPRWMCPVGSWM